MLSNQVLQKMLKDISRILNQECSVWNAKGKCLVSTCTDVKEVQKAVEEFLPEADTQEIWIANNQVCFAVCDEGELQYILAIHGTNGDMVTAGKLCVSQLENLIQAYKKKLDKNRFFQELLLKQLPEVDVFNQAKRLSISEEGRRIVFVIEPKRKDDNLVMETLKGLYATGTKDVITSVDEERVILIKTVGMAEGYHEMNKIARTIADTLSAEAMVDIRVAYGTIAEGLKEVSRSYREAGMALEAGKVFYAERNILAYNDLGIGRLIYQLPQTLCEVFLNEVFRGNAMEQFDKETLATVNAFFKNNLNISETARQMYLHRNTLGYRLDKITKTTGLDVRKFDDALTFKIALMVSTHLKTLQLKEEYRLQDEEEQK